MAQRHDFSTLSDVYRHNDDVIIRYEIMPNIIKDCNGMYQMPKRKKKCLNYKEPKTVTIESL